ncbi:sensor histidine kinase [Microbacterium hominis]|uniref:histidine kinase n=1 Tax=Microbacterium hominis TaxID=162426 RepID=A0A7D4Q188_9MICO|nr:PAS domain-containing sensor histidine kinase [Microbacterium hominis]QKJ19618.1 PAS domain-containing sensor histidine kinase [Microbacterium hominis]
MDLAPPRPPHGANPRRERARLPVPGADRADRTRERTAALNQLLLSGVVFAVAVLVAIGPFRGDAALFFFGVVLILALTAATLTIPWNRLPQGWLAAVPAIDIAAIGLMHLSQPASALGLLWVFPTTWLAGGFGALGMFAALAAIAAVTIVLVGTGSPEFTYATVLLPLVLFAAAVTGYLNARRSEAQRLLLSKQALLLRGALERTRRQEEELTEVLDAVQFGVIRIGPAGETAVTNEAHARLQRATRFADESAITAYRDDGVTPLPADDVPLARALRGEAFEDEIVWFGPPDGARQALAMTARRLTDPDGKDSGAVLVSRDVTNELTALRARDDLVASVSHELRTPLTSILGYLDLAIEDDEIPDRVRANLDIAERNAERLLGIVADILSASSTSSTVETSITPRELDAADIVRAAAEAAQPRADARAVLLDLTGLEPAPVWADPLRLRQVIDNLVSNAITHNRDAGAVHLGTTTDGRSTWILVRDTGPGISEADRGRLFQRYYRAGARHGTGTGLGLAISRDIVRAHGGEIGLHSTPGVGSTFIVKLPAAGAAHAVDDGAPDTLNDHAGPAEGMDG